MNEERIHALNILRFLESEVVGAVEFFKKNRKTKRIQRKTQYITSQQENLQQEERDILEQSWFKNWAFYVPFSMANALDIKTTVRSVNKIKIKKYTQGGDFDFTEGMTIYDTKKVYDMAWDDALQYVKYFLKVQDAEAADVSNGFRGKVAFDIYKVYPEEKAVRPAKKIEMTQYEFVRLLITGNGLDF